MGDAKFVEGRHDWWQHRLGLSVIGERSLALNCLRIVMAGLVPAIHVVRHAGNDVDARAFAAPKRLRPRRRDEPGHDGATH
ncbi:protein of unknown function [Bradyrhizobium sp. ORS 285]|nr:protein of unknown function [Bradyrhizobium sp. ORS 285]